MDQAQRTEGEYSAQGCLSELGWLGAGLVLPCASLTFYRRAARRPLFAAIIFFLLFSLVISGLQTIRLGGGMLISQGAIRMAYEESAIPEIVIRDGVATVDGEQPLVLLDEDGTIVVIDTTGVYPRLDPRTHRQGLLLTRTSLQTLTNDGRVEDIPLASFHGPLGANPIVVNADTVGRAWLAFSAIITAAAFLGLIIWNLLIRLVYLTMLGLVIWGIVALLRPHTGFAPVLVAGLYATVAEMYTSYVLGRLGIHFCMLQTFLLLPIWALALAAALAGPGQGFLGEERPLRGWRALIGVPLLIALTLDLVFRPPAAIAAVVAGVIFVALLSVGLPGVVRRQGPAAAAGPGAPEAA